MRGPSSEPWLYDYPWDKEAASEDEPKQRILGSAAVIAIILLLNVPAMLVKSLFAMLILIPFDTLAAFILVGVVRAWVLALSGRQPKLRWTEFPGFVGGRIGFEYLAPIASSTQINVVLRCVQEEIEVKR